MVPDRIQFQTESFSAWLAPTSVREQSGAAFPSRAAEVRTLLEPTPMRRLPIALLTASLFTAATAARADGPPPQAPPRHTTTPWVLVGVGAGVATIGILSFVGAVKAHDDVASESAAKGCSTSPAVSCPAGVDGSSIKTNLDGERAMNVLGVVLTSVGGAALVGGLVWHFLEPLGTGQRSAVMVAPALGPGYSGVSVAARF